MAVLGPVQCATGNPGAVVIEYCKAACEAAFFMSNIGMYDTLFWTIRCFIVNHMMEF